MDMRRHGRIFALALTALLLLAGCGGTAAPQGTEETPEAVQDTSRVADASEMTTVEDVVEEGVDPVYAEELYEGVYAVDVASSSSMFRIVSCDLTVADGAMTAEMTMSGSSYEYVYPGTAEEAARADVSELISAGESAEGTNVFTIPVSALDAGIDCAAFSRNKEQWYGRTLVFRSASLPLEAFRELVTAESLGLSVEDGPYEVDVELSGGSGRASVASPTRLWIGEDGGAMAEIRWSSPNYDYMIVDGERILPTDLTDVSVFEIPVRAFDRPIPVIADTTAMSQPYEIEYTLRLLSSSIRVSGAEAAP